MVLCIEHVHYLAECLSLVLARVLERRILRTARQTTVLTSTAAAIQKGLGRRLVLHRQDVGMRLSFEHVEDLPVFDVVVVPIQRCFVRARIIVTAGLLGRIRKGIYWCLSLWRGLAEDVRTQTRHPNRFLSGVSAFPLELEFRLHSATTNFVEDSAHLIHVEGEFLPSPQLLYRLPNIANTLQFFVCQVKAIGGFEEVCATVERSK